MTLRIESIFGEGKTRIRVSGQLRHDDVGQLKSEIALAGPPVELDLGEVDLVDIDAVRFLNACESTRVLILNCSPYIREWMVRESSRPKDHPELE